MIPRRRRTLRLHIEGQDASIEGIFVGFWARHYVLRVPSIVEAPERTIALDGHDVKVPRERVIFCQEL